MKSKFVYSACILFHLLIMNTPGATAQIDTTSLNQETIKALIDSMGAAIQLQADSTNKIKEERNKELIGTLYPEFSNAEIESITKGKVVFIDFWFVSCSACMKELPEIKRLYDKYKLNKNFQIISLTFETQSIVKKFIHDHQIGYPVYSLSKNECNRLSFTNGYPTHVILNRKGEIQFINSEVALGDSNIDQVFRENIYPVLD